MDEGRFTYDAVPPHPDARPSALHRAARGVARTLGRGVTRSLMRAAYRAVGESPMPSEPVAKSRVAPRASKALTPLRVPPRARGLRERPRLLLLNPPRFDGIPVTRFHRSEYLFAQGNPIPAMDLAYFAAAAKRDADVLLVEANAEDLDHAEVLARMEAFAPDVIVVKGVVNILDHDLYAALAYKRRHPHVRVVLSCRGAIGAEARVFEAFPDLDGVARGEVDAFAEDLARAPDLEGIEGLARPGALTPTVRVVEDLDAHPIPDFEALPDVWYRGRGRGRTTGFSAAYYGVPSGYYVTTSRGCPYTCTFCMVGGVDGRPFRHRRRDPASVVEELRAIARLRGVKDVYVFDEIFTMPGHGERVAEAIAAAELGVSFVCEGKPDLVRAPMLAAMARAGCLAIYYGVESGEERILREIEKGHDVADARRAIRLTRDAGIVAGAYAMIGFPGETWRSIVRTAGLLLELEPDLVRYDFLMPYPVTVMHHEMAKGGLLGSLDWRRLDRRISPHHDAAPRLRTRALGPTALRAFDLLFKLGFSTELRRSPVPRAA